MLLRSLFAMAALGPAIALAMPAADPLLADADVPPPVYQSAFMAYQPMQDEALTPDKVWRAANETVGRIGGHAGYLRDEKVEEKIPAPPAVKPHHAH